MESRRVTSLKTLLLAACAGVALLTPARAETLTVGIASEATAIDPHFQDAAPNKQVAYHIFEPLVLRGPDMALAPGLATSWRPVDDLTWEFALRPGVLFHDGSAFNADDVVCSFDRAARLAGANSGFGIYVEGKMIEKLDDHTIRLKTPEPYPLMAEDVARIAIVSNETGCDASREDFDSGQAAIGTGPFKFVERVPADRIVLERYDAYWGDKPAFERVVLKPLKSGPARVAALVAGDVDLISEVPPTDLSPLAENPAFSVERGVSNRLIYLHLDQFRDTSPFVTAKDGSAIPNPLKDRRVRLALSKAIDRAAIVERVAGGQAIPAGQLLPKGFSGASETIQAPEHDPEAARALLTEAGLPDGFSVTIHTPEDAYLHHSAIAEAIAEMFGEIGVETRVETVPRPGFFRRAESGGAEDAPEFSLVLLGWRNESGEASTPLRALLASPDPDSAMGASNRGRYSNADMDALLREALATVDEAKRRQLLVEATEIAMEDVALIPLHHGMNAWAAREGLALPARSDSWTLTQSVEKK